MLQIANEIRARSVVEEATGRAVEDYGPRPTMAGPARERSCPKSTAAVRPKAVWSHGTDSQAHHLPRATWSREHWRHHLLNGFASQDSGRSPSIQHHEDSDQVN